MANRKPPCILVTARRRPREALGNRDRHGVTAVVTGGYAGVGLETARAPDYLAVVDTSAPRCQVRALSHS
jgi:hypothetical protein